MKKSKIIAAGLALSMMLAVAACSSKEASDTTAEETTTTAEETTTEETTEETTVEETEESSEETEESDVTEETLFAEVKADDYNCEAIKEFITENEGSEKYMLLPMSIEEMTGGADVEGIEEAIAAIDMETFETILLCKFDTPDNAKAFVKTFVEEAGANVTYDDNNSFSAEVEGESITGSIAEDGLLTLSSVMSTSETEADVVVE